MSAIRLLQQQQHKKQKTCPLLCFITKRKKKGNREVARQLLEHMQTPRSLFAPESDATASLGHTGRLLRDARWLFHPHVRQQSEGPA